MIHPMKKKTHTTNLGKLALLAQYKCNEASEGQGHAGSGDQTVPNKAMLKLPDYDCS